MSQLTIKKFLDANGVAYLASLLDNYPDNTLLSTVIDAISDSLEEKADKRSEFMVIKAYCADAPDFIEDSSSFVLAQDEYGESPYSYREWFGTGHIAFV